ncbi:hypothetical protein AAMO2058_000532000 [Amorphochlora amoebiformis]
MLLVPASFLLLALGGVRGDEEPELHGSGTTNPSKLFWKVMDLFEERGKQNVRMTYRAVGSSTGQFEFSGSTNNNQSLSDFGAGDIPMTQSNYDRVTIGGGRTMLHVPFAVGAIAIFHNVPSAQLGGNPLFLTGCLLARIFRRNITMWDDPAILFLNPTLKVPANTNILVGHRTLGSSSTAGTTEYLAQKCPQSWDVEAGSRVPWPSDTTGVQGSDGMATFINTKPYSIGYLDAGQGHVLGLSEISLQNKDLVYLTSKQADVGAAASQALAANVLPPSGDQSFASVNLYDQSGASTWPITLMSYFYLDQDQRAKGQNGYLLKAFLDYILSDEGQTLAEEFAFVRVPEAIKAYNNVTLATILYNATGTEYTFEESTQKGTGQGEYVISAKRQSFADFDRSVLADRINKLSLRVSGLEVKPVTVTLHGSGTTNPSRLLWRVFDIFQGQSLLPLHLTYRAVGSSTGQFEFIGKNNMNMSYTDFGAGDIPIKSSDYQYMVSAGRKFFHIPFVMGAIAVFHSIPSAELEGSQLDLDSCLLARIFQRDIKTWDHPDILNKNPNLNIPKDTPIVVVRREKGSSSTSGFTKYLTLTCSDWRLGTGSKISWPNDTVGQQGSGGISSYLIDNPYSISYLDSGFGHDLNLEEVALQNRDGNFVNSKTADIGRAGTEALNEGVIPRNSSDDWSNVDLLNKPGPNTWPIVLISYIYVNSNITSLNQTGEVLKAMIKYMLDSPDLLREFRFEPVPSSLYSYNLNTLSQVITAPSAVPFVFESSSSTQAGIGAGQYVISGKRNTWANIQRTSTESDVSTLTSRVTVTESSINTLTDTCNCKEYDDANIAGMAAAALVVSILALIIVIITALVLCMRSRKSAKTGEQAERKEAYTGQPSAPPSAVEAGSHSHMISFSGSTQQHEGHQKVTK